MKKPAISLCVCSALLLGMPQASSANKKGEEEALVQEMHALNLECEKARARKLYPVRLKIYEECKAQGKSEQYCDGQAAEYDGARVTGADRYYELPECVAAFEFSKAHRLGE